MAIMIQPAQRILIKGKIMAFMIINCLELLFFSEGLTAPLVRLTEEAFIIGISETFKSDIKIIFCCFNRKRETEDAL